jgi:hypothetical protein
MALVAPVDEIGGRDIAWRSVPALLPQHHETIRLRVGQAFQQDRIENGKNRCARADAKRQRRNDDKGECRLAPKRSARVAQIATEIVDQV